MLTLSLIQTLISACRMILLSLVAHSGTERPGAAYFRSAQVLDKQPQHGAVVNGWATLIVPNGGGSLGTIRPLEAL